MQSTWIAKRWATHYLAQSSKIPRKVATSELPNKDLFTIVDEMGKREYLGEFELTVMLALLRVGEDAYGVPIARGLKRQWPRGGIASVYAALERLERKRFVISSPGEPTAERGGRAKRFFHATPLGLRQVRKTQKTLVRLWQGIPQLTGGHMNLIPPTIATWMLKHLVLGNRNEALEGDLLEEFLGGAQPVGIGVRFFGQSS